VIKGMGGDFTPPATQPVTPTQPAQPVTPAQPVNPAPMPTAEGAGLAYGMGDPVTAPQQNQIQVTPQPANYRDPTKNPNAIGMGQVGNADFTGSGANFNKFQQGMEHSAANAGASRLVPAQNLNPSPDYGFGGQPQQQEIAPPRTIGDIQRYRRETQERDKQFGMVQQELGRQDRANAGRMGAMADFADTQQRGQQFGMEQAAASEQTAYDRNQTALDRQTADKKTTYDKEQDKAATAAAQKMTPVQVTSGVAKAQDNYRAMLESPDMPQKQVEGGKEGEMRPQSFSEMLYTTDPGLWKASRPKADKQATDRFSKLPDAEKPQAANEFYMMFGERPEGY